MRSSIRTTIGIAAAAAGLLAFSPAPATASTSTAATADYDFDYDWGPYKSDYYGHHYAKAYGTVYSDDDYVHVTGKLFDYAYKQNTCAFIKVKAEGYHSDKFVWCGKGYYAFHRKYYNPEYVDVQVCMAKKFRSHGEWKYRYDYCGDWESVYDYDDHEES